MTAPAISPAPWDLRSGEKWEIRSADRDQYGDHNSEVVVDAKGNVVAYVSGFNDEGGNGQLLRAAPALRDALRDLLDNENPYPPPYEGTDGQWICECGRFEASEEPQTCAHVRARAALKQAGAL